MRSTVLSAIGLSLVLSACQTMPTASTGPALDQHLDEMLTWFPGVYDNFEQIESERESDLEANLRHRHLNHTFYPVAIPGIPGRQLYAQQYQHHDPANLYRQRIYSFEPDAEEDAIRLTIYTPESPDALTDIHLSPDRQAAMTADDFILKPGCEVYWKRAEDQFEGYLKPKACSYYSTRYETQVYLEETLTLRRDALLLNDRGVDGDGNLIFGVDDKGPTLNLKQTDFSQLDVELQEIVRLMSGDYFSNAEGGAREGRPIYMRVRNITPPLGKRHAMYAEMRHDGPNGDFYRQLIYLFDEANARSENRMQAYRVADKAAAARLIEDPSAFADGKVETTSPLSEDCYTVWSPTEAGYTSWIDPERCVITGRRGDQRRIESRTDITRAAIKQLERGYSLERELLFGNPTGEQYIWPRVSPGDVD
ncbi:MAG: CpcT/CpeT family chromophore lyase [Pseudomonadota bacterium]